MNNYTNQALEAAFAAIGELSDEQKALGFQRFEEAINSGLSVDEALWATLDEVAEDGMQWKAGNRAFNECLASQEQVEEVIESENFDPVEISGIEKAVAAATDDEELQAAGIKAYVEAIRQGQNNDNALSIALDVVTNDQESWTKGQAAYYENSEQDSETLDHLSGDNEQSEDVDQKPQGKWLARFLLAALVIVIGVVIGFSIHQPKQEAVVVEKTAVDHNLVVQQAEKALFDAGWKPGEFSLDTVDASKDKSTAGNGSFDKKGIKSVEDMMDFLKSETTASKAVVENFMKDTGSSKEDVLNPLNWVVVQSNKAFGYPANTLLKDGAVVAAGARKGGVGDIFLMFVAPAHPATATTPATPVQVKVARGACVNPQGTIPTPSEPVAPTPTETPKVYLQPKSTNPADYKYPPNKPIVPMVKTEPEKTPPKVVEEVKSVSGIVDDASNKPASEAGVVAPDATAPVENRANIVIPDEPKVNPGSNNTGTNVGDPGLPQGF